MVAPFGWLADEFAGAAAFTAAEFAIELPDSATEHAIGSDIAANTMRKTELCLNEPCISIRAERVV